MSKTEAPGAGKAAAAEKIAAERQKQAEGGQAARLPAPLLADFLSGKGGQTGCKRRNFKRAK